MVGEIIGYWTAYLFVGTIICLAMGKLPAQYKLPAWLFLIGLGLIFLVGLIIATVAKVKGIDM